MISTFKALWIFRLTFIVGATRSSLDRGLSSRHAAASDDDFDESFAALDIDLPYAVETRSLLSSRQIAAGDENFEENFTASDPDIAYAVTCFPTPRGCIPARDE